MGILLWIEESGVGIFVRESLWGYPIILSSHGVGMAIVMGVVIALNMRVLGYASGTAVLSYNGLFMAGWIGFYINLISGLLLFTNYAERYFFQGSFQLKIGLIVLGGVLLKVLMNGIRDGRDEMHTKMVSIACLSCWFGAVITGRLMAYLA
jgi:hypothetical protein